LALLSALLGDASPEIRYHAVIGIAQFAMNFPMAGISTKPTVMASFISPPSVTNEMRQHYPAYGLFAADEQEYILYWKTRLAANPVQ